MRDIYKLNESLRYNIATNNRNIVAAICVQELMLLKDYTSEDQHLDDIINKCSRDIHSTIPMKLYKIEDVMRNTKPIKVTTGANVGRYAVYYGVLGGTLNKIYNINNSVELNGISMDEHEYFVYMYPATLPELQIITLDDSFNVIQAFDYSEQSHTDNGVTTRMRVYTAANPGAFTNAKLKFK